MHTALQLLLFFLPSAFSLLLSLLPQNPPPVTYLRYDVDVHIRQDGSFQVREVQTIRFDGEFRTAFAAIPTELTDGIANVQVYAQRDGLEVPLRASADGPDTFHVSRNSREVTVNWRFAPTRPGDVRTFVVEYDVSGGLWVYPDGHIFEWRAVPADRSGVPVQASAVTVHLPQPVPPAQLQTDAFGVPYELDSASPDGPVRAVTFRAAKPIPDGVAFQVMLGIPPGLVDAQPSAWQLAEDAAELAYRLPELAASVQVQADGSLLVEELHRIEVTAGALHASERTIPHLFLDGISDVSVQEGSLQEGGAVYATSRANCEECLRTSQRERRGSWVSYVPEGGANGGAIVTDENRAGETRVEWFPPALVRGEETAFLLGYRVTGAIEILPDGQRISWAVVPPDRQAPIERAQLRVVPPPGVPAEALTFADANPELQTDGSWLLRHDGRIPPGQRWVVQWQMPAGATAATVPAWQADVERVQAEAAAAQTRRARARLIFGTVAAFLLLVGGAGVYAVWYTWGRDKPLALTAEYLTEPPTPLPPGLVAYLLEEEPGPQGALAGLFELASRGFLDVRLEEELILRRREPPAGPALPGHLQVLYDGLKAALPTEKPVPFRQVRTRFLQALPRVYAQMAQAIDPFFTALPAQARHRWLSIGQWTALAAVLLGLVLAVGYASEAGLVAVAPAVALGLLGLALMLVSRWMPQRTDAGVEEAQGWLAFKRYLHNMKKYGELADAQAVLDRYFAYAVAMDVEKVVLADAAQMGAAVPEWTFGPSWQPGPGSRRAGLPQPGGGVPTPAREPAPSRPRLDQRERDFGQVLARESRDLGSALGVASAGLGDVLDQATGRPGDTPFAALGKGAGRAGRATAATTGDVLKAILASSGSGGGSSRARGGGSSRRSSWGSSRSSGSRSRSSSRRSSSRRSGGGGRRGFG